MATVMHVALHILDDWSIMKRSFREDAIILPDLSDMMICQQKNVEDFFQIFASENIVIISWYEYLIFQSYLDISKIVCNIWRGW